MKSATVFRFGLLAGIGLGLGVLVRADIGPLFTVSLYRGISHTQVTALQQCLKKDPAVYPEGLVTGYFGSFTEKAVQRFQTKQLIVSAGTPATTGYGSVGPVTRAALNLACATSPPPPAVGIAPPPPPSQSSLTQEQINILSAAIQALDVNAPLGVTGPGGCTTIKQCQDYCANLLHVSECASFKP